MRKNRREEPDSRTSLLLGEGTSGTPSKRREERAVATFFSPVPALAALSVCYAMSAVGVGLAMVENVGLAAPSSTLLYVKPLPMYSLALETR